jgi:Tol biopolymer transport system component
LKLPRAALLVFFVPSPASGEARPVSPEHPGNAMNPLVSPDGRQVAYELSRPQEKVTDLYVLSLDTGNEELIRPPVSGGLGGRFGERKQVNHEFAWASRGGLYAFSSSGADDEFDVYVKGVSVPLGGEEKDGGPAFSRDARWLVFSSARSGDGDLYLLDVFALDKAPTRLTTNPALDFYASFSPQSDAIVYVAHAESGSNIHVLDDPKRGSASNRALTRWSGTQLKPSWSPDGKMIAFFSNRGRSDHTDFDLYVVPADGSAEPRRIAESVLPPERRGADFTPDGSAVVVVKDDPNLGDPILLVPVIGGDARPLPTGTVNNAEPALARGRDGALDIVFVAQGTKGSGGQGFRRVYVDDIPP